MEVKFGKDGQGNVPVETTKQTNETPVPGVIVESTTTAAVVPVREQPAARTNAAGFPRGDDLPGFRDVIFPRLNLVQNVGQLKDQFTPGECVFGQTTVLFTPPVFSKDGNATKQGTPPVSLTVVGLVSKRFSERVVGGIGGQIVNTEAEVAANGGTLSWQEWDLKKAAGMKLFENLIDMLIAVKRPEHIKNDDTVFSFAVGADKYALGLWAVKGTAYTNAFKKVLAFHRLAGVLKQGYPTHNFALSTRLEKFKNGNTAWIPILLPAEKSSPEFMEFVKQIVNPTA